jgi:hypothetical protein
MQASACIWLDTPVVVGQLDSSSAGEPLRGRNSKLRRPQFGPTEAQLSFLHLRLEPTVECYSATSFENPVTN